MKRTRTILLWAFVSTALIAFGQQCLKCVSGRFYSAISMTTLSRHEGGYSDDSYYNFDPALEPNAGVTIATGVDLGSLDEATLRDKYHLPETLIDKLSPALGLTGVAAQQYDEHNDIVLTPLEGELLDNAKRGDVFNTVGRGFDNRCQTMNFSDLPWQAQTAIADMAFPLGEYGIQNTNFFQDMVNKNWTAAYQELMNFNARQGYVNTRAKEDAAILKQAIDNGTLPR